MGAAKRTKLLPAPRRQCVGCVLCGLVGWGGCNPKNARNDAEGNVKTRVRAADHAAGRFGSRRPALGRSPGPKDGTKRQAATILRVPKRAFGSRLGHGRSEHGVVPTRVESFETHELRPCI